MLLFDMMKILLSLKRKGAFELEFKFEIGKVVDRTQ
jgi:hypothetical protein